MTAAIAEAAGGLGLFLVGMVVMTGGIHGLAGHSLHQWLRRATRNPASGALTGAVSTAVLQSSSATTVAAVSFVSAGLLTFSESLGIVVGANVGTTITGWMVALLGFKLKIGAAAFPLVLIGVLMRLFGRGRLAKLGMSVAGFGVLFVGIGTMQTGMAGLQTEIDPTTLPPDTWGGRALLVLGGIVITLVTQSSSAGVAMAITAIASGAIAFHQGAALVVGMDIGTTATAAMAALGAQRSARRTGLSHVVYNLLTGAMAYLLIPVYTAALAWLAPSWLTTTAELGLVAFHTVFNLVGVMVVLPFVGPFSTLMYRVVAPTARAYHLHRSLASTPEAATTAARGALGRLTLHLIADVRSALTDARLDGVVDHARNGLHEIHTFLGVVDNSDWSSSGGGARTLWPTVLHAYDHIDRLLDSWTEATAMPDAVFDPHLDDVRASLIAALDGSEAVGIERLVQRLGDVRDALDDGRHAFRARTLDASSTGLIPADQALQLLDAYRWLRRLVRHLFASARFTLTDSPPAVRQATLQAVSQGAQLVPFASAVAVPLSERPADR